MGFVKAVKHESRLRLAIAGPSGSGKTFTALTLATALGDGGSIAVIDTERGSASKYADLFTFDVNVLETFHPEVYIRAIHEAEQARYAVLVIDSLSHAWNGPGGILELVERAAKMSKSGNTYTAWADATPLQNKLIDAITRSPLHIIATMRSKQEYSLEKDERTGKTVPRKVGMAPIQRADVEYEFDLFCEMDHENNMIVQKSRCPELAGQIIAKPGAEVAETLKRWLAGAPAPERPVAPAPQPAATLVEEPEHREGDDQPANEQQRTSLRKLYDALGEEAPAMNTFTFASAAAKLRELSKRYNEKRKSA